MTRSVKEVSIKCCGRNAQGGPVLKEPILVTIRLRYNSDFASSMVTSEPKNCPHNTGGHGQRCRASHPLGLDKVGDGVLCPFAFDWPYAEEFPGWKPPHRIEGGNGRDGGNVSQRPDQRPRRR